MDPPKKKRKRVKKRGKKTKQTLLPLYKNPWDFTDSIPLLDEGLKLSKDNVTELECQLKYSIRCLAESDTDKADFLYKIFGEQIGKSPKFMRSCVKRYSVTNMEWLEKLSKAYLDSTGITITIWLQGVKEGGNGNILTLFMLSLITGVHCCVHLREKNYWTTLKEVPTTHDEFMQWCNVHLAYLGNDTFIELVLRTATVSYKVFGIDQPLDLIESAPAIIGTLTSAETSTLDMLLKLEKTSSDSSGNDETPFTQESAHIITTKDDSNDDGKQELDLQHDDSESTICYDYMDYMKDNPNAKTELETCQTTPNIAVSMHRDHSTVKTSDKGDDGSDAIKQKDNEPPEKATPAKTAKTKIRKKTLRIRLQKLKKHQLEASTTQTMKISNLGATNTKATKSHKKSHILRPITKKEKTRSTDKTPKFAISSHRLLRKKRKKYNFRCPITGCKKVFNTVKDWNSHHLSLHSAVKYQCSICLKWMTTPNRFNDHKYLHQDARYKCGRCNKSFYFKSGLQLHKNLHRRYKVYKCFAKNCDHSYKWPQDLLRHVKVHLKIQLCCEYCNYISHDRRLLRQHKQKHQDIKKYVCRRNCDESFKHAMQRYRHEKKCH